MTDLDFCVVGAGFASLTATRRRRQGGHSVVLLEGRDRVGHSPRPVTTGCGSTVAAPGSAPGRGGRVL